MAKKAYIGVENFVKRDLPSGYTQIEYIESSNTQYINTGFLPNSNTRIVMDVKWSGSGGGSFFGTRDAASATGTGNNTVFIASTGKPRCDYYGTSVTGSSVIPTSRIIVDRNKNVTTIGSEVVTNTANASGTSSYPLYLFTMNNVGSTGTKAVFVLFSCQIYDNGILVRDFVPCKNSSGAIGLYDLANSEFYTNDGTSAFTAGATYGNVARESKQIYIGIDGIARKVKKAYVGVNGVARLFYQTGVEWTKYSCTRTSSTSYTKEATPSGGATTQTLYNDQTYSAASSYSFSSSKGYYTNDTDTWYGDSMVGFYDVSPTLVQRYASVQASSTEGNYTQYKMTTVASAVKSSSTSYSKGSTNYGVITADEGALPENGTLIRGSATGSYCVLLVNGTYYYYEKA